jgi:hypothetical protein
VLWTVTGFYMVIVHIDTIHGDNLVRTAASKPFDLAQLIAPSRIAANNPGSNEIRLQRHLDRPVWRVDGPGPPFLIDAESGRRLPPLNQLQAEAAARSFYAGDPTIVSSKLLTQAPLEMQTRKPPYWQIEFKGWNQPTFYISPATGELISRRHALWRVFDFAWMLHIMDYDERSDVNNPLLRVATWSAVAMALSGAWLLVWSLPRRRKKKA